MVIDGKGFERLFNAIFRRNKGIMRANDRLVNHIKKAEGLNLKQYKSKEGGTDTIGYGHKLKIGEFFGVISQDKANELLSSDISRSEDIVIKKLGSRKVNQRTFNLLVDLAFNTGTIYNHVLNSLDKNTFEKDYNKVAITINGEFAQGLLNRRNNALTNV